MTGVENETVGKPEILRAPLTPLLCLMQDMQAQ